MLETLVKRIHEQMPRYIETLESLIRIPSISFDNFDPNEVPGSRGRGKNCSKERAPEREVPDASERAFRGVRGARTRPSHPTILLYAHHDVQPTMREDPGTALRSPRKPQRTPLRARSRG